MKDDDIRLGTLLSRREALRLLGITGAAIAVGQVSWSFAPTGGSCVVRPALTEGPYFVDELLNRSDIRTDPSDGSVRPGARLDLTFLVTRLADCSPLSGVVVDLWHNDHLGVYSDVVDPSFNTVGKKFLRGYQVTDAEGIARFITIYPGWYSGRTVHMHFKIRSAPEASPGFEFTSQLFFDDAFTDTVYTQAPYTEKGPRNVRNSGDGIYNQGGDDLTLAVSQGDEGYASSFAIALDVPSPAKATTWGGIKASHG